jgi:hypothetical protein
MKKLLFSLSLLAGLVCFQACTTDVNLYADYKDIPVIYGLIDVSQDTNFIRINRAFSGNNDHPINANEVAMIADSCNYPGKLDAYIKEYRSGFGNSFDPTGRIIRLDTMTIHDKQEGIFYSPDQKVYWTNERFNVNTNGAKYKYKLFVHKGNDTITSETGVVGGENFKLLSTSVSFSSEPSDASGRIKFKLADNAAFYEVKLVFNYKESKNGGPLEYKQVVQNFGMKSVDELLVENNTSYVVYAENSLFIMLEAAIGADTMNVVRYFDEKPVEIMIAAGGDELYNYVQINSQSGFSQTIPDYTNVNGGYGVFSSRLNLVEDIRISSRTQTDLYGKRAWGFMQQ